MVRGLGVHSSQSLWSLTMCPHGGGKGQGKVDGGKAAGKAKGKGGESWYGGKGVKGDGKGEVKGKGAKGGEKGGKGGKAENDHPVPNPGEIWMCQNCGKFHTNTKLKWCPNPSCQVPRPKKAKEDKPTIYLGKQATAAEDKETEDQRAKGLEV